MDKRKYNQIRDCMRQLIKGTPFENKVFFVGGCCRDDLMGLEIKDIDMTIRDENLMDHVRYERQVMDKILDCLKAKNHPLRHWFNGHFHQSWHQEIEGIQYNMLDIMELRELRTTAEKQNVL